MLISVLSSEQDASPAQEDVPWSELVESLTTHQFTACRCHLECASCAGTGVKDGAPCPCCKGAKVRPRGASNACPQKSGPGWVPANFTDGHRSKKSVGAVSVFVADLDHLASEDVLAAAMSKCGPYRLIVHSTHSHRPAAGDWCVRVVIDLDRPVTPEEWPRFRTNVLAHLGLPADPATKDASRFFYLPSAPAGAEVIAEHQDGVPLKVDDFIGTAAAQATLAAIKKQGPTAGQAPDPATLRSERPQEGTCDMDHLRATLRTLSNPDSRKLVRPLLDGTPLAVEGARDDTLQRVAGILAFAFPATTPVSAFLELVRASVLSMPGAPPEGQSDWLGVMAEKLERAFVDKAASDAKREALTLELYQAMRRRASKESTPEDPDPTAPYPEALVEKWAREQGCASAAEFRDRWLITDGITVWAFINGAYERPLSMAAMEIALPRDLARVEDESLRLYRLNGKTGEIIWTPVKNVLREWGSVARQVEADLALQKSRYDSMREIFYEAVCPLRPLVPEFDPQIDKWLRMLGGEDAELFLDWVATCWDLSRQTCALYLHSGPGTGKTLMAQGLAKLWTRGGPSELGNVFGGFNDTLVNCPLVFADECLPASGKHLTSELRKLIGTTTRTLNRKFKNAATLRGAVRLIIAANNDRLLETGEELSNSDLAAVAGRFLFLDTSDEAVSKVIERYLQEEVGLERINNDWLDGSGIAKHALWLKENRKVKTTGRFLVEGRQTGFHEQMLTASGYNALVAEFIVGWISSNVPTDTTDVRCQVGSGEVWVATELLASEQMWVRMIPSVHVLSGTKIGRALGNLSEAKSERVMVTMPDHSTRQITFHRLKKDLILSWARRNELGDLARIEKRITARNAFIDAARGRRTEVEEKKALEESLKK